MPDRPVPTDAHRELAEEIADRSRYRGQPVLIKQIAQGLADAEARGRAAVLAELVDLLRDARSDLRDPDLRRKWGSQKRRLLDAAIDAQEATRG